MQNILNIVNRISYLLLLMVSCLLLYLLKPSFPADIKTIIQTIGIALITILIPVVLFIFSLEKENLFSWDKNVIIDKVIEAKVLLVANLLIFIPLFFWDSNNSSINLILFGLVITGVIIQIKILVNSYKWTNTVEMKGVHDPKNYRTMLRLKYLQDSNENEKGKIWSITWQTEKINPYLERDLMQIFTSMIETLLQKKECDQIVRYLNIFLDNMASRQLDDWSIYPILFTGLLNWYHENHADYLKGVSKRTTSGNSAISITIIISRLIQQCAQSALKTPTAYLFFDILNKHVKGKDGKYLEDLFYRCICRTFFDDVSKSNQIDSIWEEYFPKEWKITYETMSQGDNVIVRIWLNSFFQWALHKAINENTKIDGALDDTSYYLFPSVEPSLWANIIFFVFTPFSDDNDRINNVLIKAPNFGLRSRFYMFEEPEDKMGEDFSKRYKEEENGTYKLALKVFGSHLSKSNMDKYIEILKKLTFAPETREELRRQKYLRIFQGIISVSTGAGK